MKYIYISILSIVFLFGSYIRTSAQGELSLTATSTSAAPMIDSTFSVFTKLKNVSLTDTFTGTVDFLAKNLTNNNLPSPLVFGKPAFAGGTIITLAPQQEMNALFTFELIPAYFQAGPDIIIVWPVAAVQVPIRDSARAPIFISQVTGIEDEQAEHLKAYVSNDQLIIQSEHGKNSLRQVRIFDLTGREVSKFALSETSATIPLQELSKGVYIADISTATGTVRRLKFVK